MTEFFDIHAAAEASVRFDDAAPAAPAPTEEGPGRQGHKDGGVEDGPGWQDGRIATMDAFHRASRDYREALEAAREVDAQHQAEIAPLLAKLEAAQKRADAARKPIEDHARWLEGHLLGFAQTHRAEILKGQRRDAKSALLQSGVRVAWRTKPGGLHLLDEPDARERLISWARDHWSDATEQRWEVDVGAIKRALAGTDEVPPGMERILESETLTITFDKEET